ncbi:MAG: hypothetical protein NT159_07185 [Proteobacteria bacterium]|nr:hypothetical protein [Pseudomonadota bacterium]
MTALAGPSQAQTSDSTRISELEKKLERSLELINQLSTKITQMEKSVTASTTSPAAPAQQAAKVEQLEKSISEISDNLSRRATDTGLPMHGFTDVGLASSNEDQKNVLGVKGRKGFNLGNFDFYMAPQFGDRVKSLIELNFEVSRAGAVTTDLERLQVGYTFSDAATGWVGRFHTPYGYWNTAYHHGAQIQTTITRPKFLDFEDKGGILPAHTTGLWLNGKFGTAAGKINYDLTLGNAPALSTDPANTSLSSLAGAGPFSAPLKNGTYAGSGTLDMQMAGALTHRTMTGFNISFDPGAAEGLRLGLHGLRGEVADDSVDLNRTRLGMFGGYGTFITDQWEILGEYYHFRNTDVSGRTGDHNSNAGYIQVGYNTGLWTPFVRYEQTRLDQTDNYFAVQESGRSYKRSVVGLRYDVDPKAALKVELNSTRKELGPKVVDNYPEARVQYSIRF